MVESIIAYIRIDVKRYLTVNLLPGIMAGMFSFHFAKNPALKFGAGMIREIPGIIAGRDSGGVVCITGSRSFRESDRWGALRDGLSAAGIKLRDYSVRGEPSPETVDAIAAECREHPPGCVLAIGGGSVIDTGKAVSAMIPAGGSVERYLEGVGTEEPPGEKVFFIAVPTTSGTGSEATKNAVISRPGAKGFKKSLRHDNYVPDTAVIDPELMLSCPPDITAASGLDAVTQLLEGFVSTNASPLTDAIAGSGLMAAGRSFARAVEQGDNDLDARAHMAYAACMSGIVLANAGLGIVHGIAGYLGGRFAVPHGAACGTLLPKATDLIIEKLFDLEEENNIPLLKYAEAGKYLTGRDFGSVEDNCRQLVDQFYVWTEKYEIPRLTAYGITDEDCRQTAKAAGRKNTPVTLSEEDCFQICEHRL